MVYEAQDLNVERCTKAAAATQNAIASSKTGKRAPRSPGSFSRGRHGTASSEEPGPVPSRSGVNTLAARPPTPAAAHLQLCLLPPHLPPASVTLPACSLDASPRVPAVVFCTTVLEKEMAPHSSTLAWKIPWMEEPGRLQSAGSKRVRHNSDFTLTHCTSKVLYCKIKNVYFCLCFL